MTGSTTVLRKSVKSDHDAGEASHGVASGPKPQASRGSGGATIDLLLIYSPIAHPLPPHNGIRRWEYAGRIYREILLDTLYAVDDEGRSIPGFHQMDSLMRAKPYHGRAA